ncbi:penicillin-binding protein 2 [Clostridium sp. D2Q-11]|uniref:beta-lactamase n=1 Tax=Anaeromonas frigoriresistens TaxID=2683708 RepID=A0A942UWS1_9FIRM|nr:penicillin-binding protein 2 [Anaeromonas frigoriresistens]MBS4540028.1 penicillin-binding protein 2 [Anaeromonas frigoriresistens]
MSLLNKRLKLLYKFSLVLFCVLILRISWIQLMLGPKYKEKVQNQWYYPITNSSVGTIYDRNMVPLTNKVTQKYLYVPKSNLMNDMEYYEELLKRLNYSEKELNKYINDEYTKVIKIPISEDFNNEDLENTFILEESEEYNDENILAHVIGYINQNGEGIGIRKMYNETLSKGNKSKVLLTFDGRNRLLYDKEDYLNVSENKSTIRNSIQLTIDYDIQKIVEETMESRGYEGVVIVTEVETGEILALTSQPDFNLNDIGSSNKSNDNSQINKAIKFHYDPASIFKTIVLLSALENNIDLDEKFLCEGSIDIGGIKPYSCYNEKVHGELTIKEAYSYSCNTIFIQLAQKIGGEKIIETAKKMGLDEKVDIGLAGEIKGKFAPIDNVKGPGIGNLAMGQAYVRLTPIQINNLTMIIANDGIKKDISIIKGYATNTGKESQRFTKKEDQWVIDSSYTNVIKEYMESVVKEGTGSLKIKLEEYGGAAGKTGTSEKSKGNSNGLFTGYSPSDNSKYAITIVVENIARNETSSNTAAVVFNEIIQKINQIKNK